VNTALGPTMGSAGLKGVGEAITLRALVRTSKRRVVPS
jgi:hypothetical protein